MAQKGLSPKMQSALAVVTREWRSAYSMQLSLATLQALRARGLIENALSEAACFRRARRSHGDLQPSNQEREDGFRSTPAIRDA